MKEYKGHVRRKGWGQIKIYEPSDPIDDKVKDFCLVLAKTKQGNSYGTFIIDSKTYYYVASGCYFYFSDIEVRSLYNALNHKQ